MQYECISCGTTFTYDDGEWKKGYLVCPSCGSEDLTQIEALLEVDAFPIGIETLADAVKHRNTFLMEQSRIAVIHEVVNSLTIEDKKRLQLYQDKNDPCKEVE